jgi:hypothetical protein
MLSKIPGLRREMQIKATKKPKKKPMSFLPATKGCGKAGSSHIVGGVTLWRAT